MGQTSFGEKDLEQLQRGAFSYFLKHTNRANGLVADSTRPDAPVSITAVGLALASYPVGVQCGFLTREQAREHVLATLRFLWNSPQGTEPDATGYQGFFYHFLDTHSGRRTWKSELSTIDTTFLLAGALAAAAYFDRPSGDEDEIRALAESLYRRTDWQWALNGGRAVCHGWKPECGFLNYRWYGYSEALLLYALGLGSPTFPLPEASYREWTSTYQWENLYGCEFLFAAPLFVHQLAHVWIDFRGIQDEYMREKHSDYFENTRRAICVQRQYTQLNAKGFKGYKEDFWGITASDGPGKITRRVDGIERRFYGYVARGVPYGPDDGTIAPWAVAASLPFAPETVLSSLQHITEYYPHVCSEYGFKCSFNPTFSDDAHATDGWISDAHYGLDQGPVVLMIENYRSGLTWRLMRQCPYLVNGLRRVGFTKGWLRRA